MHFDRVFRRYGDCAEVPTARGTPDTDAIQTVHEPGGIGRKDAG